MATGFAGIIVLSLCRLLTACQEPAASLAIIDPVFAYLSPDSVKSFSSVAQELAFLPDSGASEILYATLDEQAPQTVFLSPLLASEIEAILSRNDKTRVVYLGNVQPKPHQQLHAAVFSSVDAAARGGTVAAAESIRLMAQLSADNGPPAVAAVFSGVADAENSSEAFLLAYRAAGGPGEPMIEIFEQRFAQAEAERLKTLDIRVGYIAATPRDAENWARQAFDQSAYLAMEYALPSYQTTSQADTFIVWDIEATLSALVQKHLAKESSTEKGLWKTVTNDQTDSNRR